MVLYLDVVMDEEQVLRIFNDLTTKNPPFPYWKFDKIELRLVINATTHFLINNAILFQKYFPYT